MNEQELEELKKLNASMVDLLQKLISRQFAFESLLIGFATHFFKTSGGRADFDEFAGVMLTGARELAASGAIQPAEAQQVEILLKSIEKTIARDPKEETERLTDEVLGDDLIN